MKSLIPVPLNSQINSAVNESNLIVLGQSSSVPLGASYLTRIQNDIVRMSNLTTQQQYNASLQLASTVKGYIKMLNLMRACRRSNKSR